MPPKKVVPKAASKKAPPPPPPPPVKKAAPKAVVAKKASSKEEESEPPSPEESPQKKRITGRKDSPSPAAASPVESPASAAARVMQFGSSPGVPVSPRSAALVPASPQQAVLATRPVPGRLRVLMEAPRGTAGILEEGLIRLRRNSKFCDVTIVSGFGRIPAHRAVLASHSEKLAARLESAPAPVELDLQLASHEAVDLVVRFVYGEVSAEKFQPSTPKVNEEVLRISSELGLPLLAELCALRLAEAADTSNVVPSVRLCEEYGLPDLRAALLSAIVE
ncbi:unnamed protein product, partial [Polarella glacialis]